jgi:hypothetical protein
MIVAGTVFSQTIPRRRPLSQLFIAQVINPLSVLFTFF